VTTEKFFVFSVSSRSILEKCCGALFGKLFLDVFLTLAFSRKNEKERDWEEERGNIFHFKTSLGNAPNVIDIPHMVITGVGRSRQKTTDFIKDILGGTRDDNLSAGFE
jgi:GTPase SAR1 family protein